MALGIATDLKRSVREIPPWGWGIVGIGALYLVLHRAKNQGVSSATGGPIVAAQSPLNISDPSGGMSAYIESLNSGYAVQAEQLNGVLQTLQDQNAALLDSVRSQQAANLAGQGSTSPPDYGSFPNNINPIVAPLAPVLQPTGPSGGGGPGAGYGIFGYDPTTVGLGISPPGYTDYAPGQAASGYPSYTPEQPAPGLNFLPPPAPTSPVIGTPNSGDAPPVPTSPFVPEQRPPWTIAPTSGGSITDLPPINTAPWASGLKARSFLGSGNDV